MNFSALMAGMDGRVTAWTPFRSHVSTSKPKVNFPGVEMYLLISLQHNGLHKRKVDNKENINKENMA